MSQNLTFRQTPYGSAAYEASVALRYEVLRQPLGLEFSSEQLETEASAYHLGCYRDGELLGCLILVPCDDEKVKMRQVAVADHAQGQGVGRALVAYAEDFARQHGFREITMHARETAVPFYEKLGYRRHGECFEEITIPHWQMCKQL